MIRSSMLKTTRGSMGHNCRGVWTCETATGLVMRQALYKLVLCVQVPQPVVQQAVIICKPGELQSKCELNKFYCALCATPDR
jgi:hypothetical protein